MMIFHKTAVLHEDYPVYEAKNETKLWWMANGTNGYWIVNKTPGELGDDQLKSKLGKKSCPDGSDVEWEGGESPFLCGCETTCPSPVKDETRERCPSGCWQYSAGTCTRRQGTRCTRLTC